MRLYVDGQLDAMTGVTTENIVNEHNSWLIGTDREPSATSCG